MGNGKGTFWAVLISEFSRATGLGLDTIRYYVRRDLLRPQVSVKGGRNPYQMFGSEDVRTAELIRLGQALGLTLREIGSLLKEEQTGAIDAERSLEILRDHRAKLAARADEMSRLVEYLDAKIGWVSRGSDGPAPAMSSFISSRTDVDPIVAKPVPRPCPV